MYILYGGKFTRAIVVEMVLAEGDIAYELRTVDIAKREQQSPEFLKMNPAGWVPVLITPQGDSLYETPAINLYLADHYGLTHFAPGIDDPSRGRFLSGLFYLTDELEPALKRYFYPERYGAGSVDAPTIRARAYRQALDCFSVIDKRLAEQGPYHLGERFSLADLTMAYWAGTFEEANCLDGLPAVLDCVERVTRRPKLKPLFERTAHWVKTFYELRAAGKMSADGDLKTPLLSRLQTDHR